MIDRIKASAKGWWYQDGETITGIQKDSKNKLAISCKQNYAF
jgi:hypothetical protein